MALSLAAQARGPYGEFPVQPPERGVEDGLASDQAARGQCRLERAGRVTQAVLSQLGHLDPGMDCRASAGFSDGHPRGLSFLVSPQSTEQVGPLSEHPLPRPRIRRHGRG